MCGWFTRIILLIYEIRLGKSFEKLEKYTKTYFSLNSTKTEDAEEDSSGLKRQVCCDSMETKNFSIKYQKLSTFLC